MTAWVDLDDETRKLVENALTPKQLETVKLLNAQQGDGVSTQDAGTRKIALQLGISRAAVRERLDAAERRILKALKERKGTE